MGLKGKLDKLQKAIRGQLGSFELKSGQRYYFDPEETGRATFLCFAKPMTADHRREPRPSPPDILQAVARARDRGDTLSRVENGFSHLLVYRKALVERGEFVPRSLVAGGEYEDLGVLEDLSE